MALVELDEFVPDTGSPWTLVITVGAVLALILGLQAFVIATILAVAP